MSALAERLQKLRLRIAAAAARRGRSASDVKLLAVAKTQPAEQVLAGIALGLRAFGENRVQEAERKIPAVQERSSEKLEWHLIGPLQSNKVRRAVQLCDAIQSVDRVGLVELIERAAAGAKRRPQLYLQVNLDAEPQKGGCAPGEVVDLAKFIERSPHLELVGLMAIPREQPTAEQMRPAFARLRALLEHLNRARVGAPPLRELSMGMSEDFEVAIEEGATCVRIGTALFGARETQ
jgi:pyridoxal phosphate enzyme (YggS family)